MAGERSTFRDEGNELDDDDEMKALRRPLIRKPSLVGSQQEQDDVPILTRSDSRNGNWSPYLKDLHVLSLAFLFVFLAYSAVQNLESSINTDQGLGSASLGVLYLSLTLSCLVASMVVMWLGSKNALILGLSGYWAFIVANIFPSWYTLIPAAIYLGFTASVIWVAEGTYLTLAAKKHAAACDISEATALGSFNGEFWGVYQSNQVVGNILTLFLLQYGKDLDSSSESSSGSATILFVVFLGSMTIGTILMCLLNSHTDTSHLPSGRRVAITPSHPGFAKASFRLLSDKKMQLLTFPCFYTGMQQAFVWGNFTRDVVTPSLGLSWVGGIMAAYGAANAVGSYTVGRKLSGSFSINCILCGGAVCQLLVMCGLFFKDMYSSKEPMNFLIVLAAAILWGLGDATIHTQFSALLGIYYPRDIEAAFAQWKIWQSAGTSVIFFASPYLSFNTNLSLLFPSLLVSMGLFFIAMVRYRD
ncbi:unnamed protein product [Calypogeia fissa]